MRTLTLSDPALLGSGVSYSALVAEAGSVWAFWRLQETSGSTVADTSGNSRTGTLISGVTLNADGPLGGRSASFSGSVGSNTSTTGISVASMFDLTASWSVAGWLRQTAGGLQSYIVGTNVVTGVVGDNYWSVSNRGGEAFMVQSRVAQTTTRAPTSGDVIPADSAWHHFAATRSGSTLRFYVDGDEVSTATNPTIPGGMTSLAIGRVRSGPDTYAITGRLALLSIHTATLTADQVAGLAAASGI